MTQSNTTGFKVGSLVIPTNMYPTKVVASDNLVSRSWNNIRGEFQDVLVNMKYKVEWHWEIIDKDTLEMIMTYLRNQIINQKSRMFNVNTTFPGMTGWWNMYAYLGTPIEFTSTEKSGNVPGQPGVVPYYNLRLAFIEKNGTVLL